MLDWDSLYDLTERLQPVDEINIAGAIWAQSAAALEKWRNMRRLGDIVFITRANLKFFICFDLRPAWFSC